MATSRLCRTVSTVAFCCGFVLAGCGTGNVPDVKETLGEGVSEVPGVPDVTPAEGGEALPENDAAEAGAADGDSQEVPVSGDPFQVDVPEPDDMSGGVDEAGDPVLNYACGGNAKSKDISGTVYYQGAKSEQLFVVWFEGKEKPSGPLAPPQGGVGCKNAGFPNEYGLDLKNQPGTYWVAALLDLDGDMKADVAALYPDPIELTAGDHVTGIDLHLE